MWHLLKIGDRTKLKIFLSYQKKIKISKEAFMNCLKGHQSKLIDVDDLNIYNKNIFLNMNSPEDYELIKNIYEKH